MKISRMVCELWSLKDFKLTYKDKFDLVGQRSLVEKVVQFNEKIAEKV